MHTAPEIVRVDPTDTAALTAFRHLADRAFMQPLGDPAQIAALTALMKDDRLQSVQQDGRPVATFRSFDAALTLPGGALTVANAVSAVTVAATHRRRGILTAMMKADLDGARERGQHVCALFAAEAAIYGRFGFGPATRNVTYTVDSARARFRDDAPMGGSVELREPGEVGAELRAVQDRARRSRPGGLERSPEWWRLTTLPGALPAATRVFLHRDEDGTPDGYALAEATSDWDHEVSNSRMVVPQLLSATREAYCGLVETLLATDLVRTVAFPDRPVDDDLPWLLVDERAVATGPVRDALWLRVLDVPGLLGSRSWWGAGSLVIEVLDDAGFADGTYRIAVAESDRGTDGWAPATVTASTDEPDLQLPVDALAALVLGGTDVTALARAGRVSGTPDAIRRAQLLFTVDSEPWCDTHF